MFLTTIFIDGAYVKKINDKKIDYRKFIDNLILQSRGTLFRASYYDCLPYVDTISPSDDDENRQSSAQGFFDVLNKIDSFEVRLGVLKKRGEDRNGKPIFVQKKVDLMLGLDLSSACLANHISQIILVAGDGDFLPAIEFAKSHMKKTVLAHGEKKTYDENLYKMADSRIKLDSNFFDSILLDR